MKLSEPLIQNRCFLKKNNDILLYLFIIFYINDIICHYMPEADKIESY